MDKIPGLDPSMVIRRRGILLLGKQLVECRLVPQREANLQIEVRTEIGDCVRRRAFSGDRMVADQWRSIIAIAETIEVADAEKSDQEGCDDDRKQFCGT